MTPCPAFTLTNLHHCADSLLSTHPDPVVKYLLTRDVLRRDPSSPEMRQLKAAAHTSRWVKQLEDSQLPDGSWGRFHSQDTKVKTVFRTTEQAIQRALALGLEPGDPILQRVREYILQALAGSLTITDPPEKNERWDVLIPLVLAGSLARLDPHHPVLDSHHRLCLEICRQSFVSGSYRLDDEAAAYPQLCSIQAPGGFLESQYMLWILSTRPLPTGLERLLVEWIWNKPDGIRYQRQLLAQPPGRHVGYWLRSQKTLALFPAWREIAAGVLNGLWESRNGQAMWDFQRERLQSVEFPLSESWRSPGKRAVDVSTHVLGLLRMGL